jgi:hypothetical protein
MKPNKVNRVLDVLCFGFCLAAAPSNAGLIFTIEDPGVQQTTVAGALTETFDALAPGPVGTYNSPIGTYEGGQVNAADQYGGAGSSQFYAIGVQSGTTSATLTFTDPKTYFGMWWSAGDAQNRLEFYDQTSSLLASYQIGDILPLLSSDYFGNPNPPPGRNTPEAYVYLNFTVTGDSRISQVVFLNNLRSGFEMDNHSVFDRPITPPGKRLPDAGGSLTLLVAGAAGVFLLRRRSR